MAEHKGRQWVAAKRRSAVGAGATLVVGFALGAARPPTPCVTTDPVVVLGYTLLQSQTACVPNP